MRHERTHVAHIAFHHNVGTLQGDAAAGRGIAVDHQKTAMGRGRSRLAGIAGDVNLAGHHVLRQAGAGIAVHLHFGLLVHAGAIVAHMAIDRDFQRGIQTARQSMHALGIGNSEAARFGVLQGLVGLPDGDLLKVKESVRGH